MHRIFETNTDLLIFGLRTKDIRKPFRVGSLVVSPDFDLRSYLAGYNYDDIQVITDSEVIYAQYQPNLGSRIPLFSPKPEDDGLIPFRLFKPGWLSAINVMPVIKTSDIEIRGELGSLEQIFGQNWAEPMNYEVSRDDIPRLQRIYHDLEVVPAGYLELALRRFSHSYEYYSHSEYAGLSELDDCLVDLVIALESITSRGGDSIRQSMALRTALLLGNTLDKPKDVEQTVKRFYDHRSAILHGSQRDTISEKDQQERFIGMEALRDLVRKAINASIGILKTFAAQSGGVSEPPKTVAEAIDYYLFDKLRA